MNAKELKEARARAYDSLLYAAVHGYRKEVCFWAESLTFWSKRKPDKKKA